MFCLWGLSVPLCGSLTERKGQTKTLLLMDLLMMKLVQYDCSQQFLLMLIWVLLCDKLQ